MTNFDKALIEFITKWRSKLDIQTDFDNQLIIYTGLMLSDEDDESYVPYTSSEEE